MQNNDLGMYLYAQQQISHDSSPFWIDWTIYNIHVQGPNVFLSVGSAVMNGEVLEYIAEFDMAIFDKMLSLLPKFLSAALKDKVKSVIKKKKYPIVMDFEDDVAELRPRLAAEVKLGEMKKLGDRKYVPFIIIDVMNPDVLNSH